MGCAGTRWQVRSRTAGEPDLVWVPNPDNGNEKQENFNKNKDFHLAQSSLGGVLILIARWKDTMLYSPGNKKLYKNYSEKVDKLSRGNFYNFIVFRSSDEKVGNLVLFFIVFRKVCHHLGLRIDPAHQIWARSGGCPDPLWGLENVCVVAKQLKRGTLIGPSDSAKNPSNRTPAAQ